MGNLDSIFNDKNQKERFNKVFGDEEKKKDYDLSINEEEYKYVGVDDKDYEVYLKLVIGHVPDNKQVIPTIYRIDKENKKKFIEVLVKANLKLDEISNDIINLLDIKEKDIEDDYKNEEIER